MLYHDMKISNEGTSTARACPSGADDHVSKGSKETNRQGELFKIALMHFMPSVSFAFV